MMHLPLSLVAASGKAHTEASPVDLLLPAAALVDPEPRLPVRGQLGRGEAGVLDRLEVSDFYIYSHLIFADLKAGFDGSSFGSSTDAASDASASSTPSWFGGASKDFSGGWWHSRIMRHRQ